ncbi:MAG: malto-oligosyltrehalose trehalohydrolase [Bacteroidales bacterium]|nr:malto-oligosyltrehalose trehalohydrolase [Bacteroidales bacterium]
MNKAGPEIQGSSCSFTVWAPLRKSVELHILHPVNNVVPMSRDLNGYWKVMIPGISNGTLYKYMLDKKLLLPDPASLSQPEGVHGPSEVTDLQQFRWTDDAWKNIPAGSMIFYELHTGTFSEEGNFEGIIQRLPYLLDLGINTIELMPVSQFPGKRNWGYDGVYPYSVQDSYGGPGGLMKLVDACHSSGIAVVLDVVYNHLGPEGNYLGAFGPYFTDRYKTPWGRAVNFDDSYADGVRNYFLQNALMWLEDFHIDGLRLDAVHAIYDFSVRHIMQDLAEEVMRLNEKTGRNHYLIAESALNDSRYITGIKDGGYGLDAQWNDDFHHGLHALVTGESKGYYVDFQDPGMLAKAFKNGFAFDGQYSEFRKRKFGNSSHKNPGSQFVVFSQNHDQTGNRKYGERLSTLVSFEMLKVIAGAVFISPFLPMIFMGEEYGEEKPFLYFVDHTDKKLNKLVREGRQKEFRSFYPDDLTPAPDPSDIDTFLQSRLTIDPLQNSNSKALHEYYKALIKLKKNHPVLKQMNKDEIEVDNDGRIFKVERWHKDNRIIAWLNFSDQTVEKQLPAAFTEKNIQILIDSSDNRWNGPCPDHCSENSVNGLVIINRESMVVCSVQEYN